MFEFFSSLTLVETVLGSALILVIVFAIIFMRRAFDHMETITTNHTASFDKNSAALDKNSENLLKGLEKISDAQEKSGDAIANSIERALLIQTLKNSGNNQVIVDNKPDNGDGGNSGM